MSQLFTLDEVKPHNGKDGAKTWIVLHDNVYDVTDYLKDHPGGGELITDVAGRDCSKEFDDFGHSSDAKQMLKKFKIGELVEEDKKANRKKKIAKAEIIENIDIDETVIIKRRRRFRFFFCA